MEASERRLLEAVHKVRDGHQYSDLTIVCGNETFHVHKVLVCVQSKYFEAACKPSFEEGTQSKITLPPDALGEGISKEVVPQLLRSMTDFFYGKANYHHRPAVRHQLHWLAMLYVTADRFQVDNMKEDLVDKFQATVDPLKTSTTQSSQSIRTIKFLNENLPETDRKLQQIMIKWVVEHWSDLLYPADQRKAREAVTYLTNEVVRTLRDTYRQSE